MWLTAWCLAILTLPALVDCDLGRLCKISIYWNYFKLIINLLQLFI